MKWPRPRESADPRIFGEEGDCIDFNIKNPMDADLEDLAQVATEVENELTTLQVMAGTGEDITPSLHAMSHEVVEHQLAGDTPPGIRRFFHRSLDAGLSRKEAIHLIGHTVTCQISDTLQNQTPFDCDEYFTQLELELDQFRDGMFDIDDEFD